MKYYFAPMEGITGYIYRNAHHKYFPGMDRYFTPFLVPNQNKKFSSKEKNDILPEHNDGLKVIPQILTNRSEHFICAASELEKYGYEEINLNLGCPSGTVVSKDKGAGFLAKREELDHFLDEIFSKCHQKISIKTRIGKDSPEEWDELLEIFNQYPLSELIIHPRIQTDYYKNEPDWEAYRKASALSKNPICYNGDLFTFHHYERWKKEFPESEQVMLGRGLLACPWLVQEIKGEGIERDKKQHLKDFHDCIYHGYQEVFSGDRNTLFKMKELWFYLIHLFPDSSKYEKKIKKAERFEDYENAVDGLFKLL